MTEPENDRSTSLADLLGPQRVLPLLVFDDVAVAPRVAALLAENGLPTIEVALRTDEALAAIEAIKAAVPAAVVGVGTVLSAADLARAVAAGGGFAVSPGSTAELLSAARACSIPFVPGIATASELMRVTDQGFIEVKCFPAGGMGGPATIAALASVVPGTRLMPTGGIDAVSAPDYLGVSGVFAVAGSWVCPRELIRSASWEEIGARARAAAQLRGSVTT